MDLFKKRPLSLILCIMLGGFSLLYTLPTVYKIIISVSFSVITATVIMVPRARERGAILLILSALSLSSILSTLYFDVIFYPTKHYGEESEIIGKIVDEESDGSGTNEVIIKVKYIDGKRSFYKFKGFVYSDGDAPLVGSEITFNAKILDFDTTETFDYKNYYTSRGISARVNIKEISDVKDGTIPLAYRFKLMRDAICDYAARVSDEDAGGSLSALLFGDRERLPNATECDYMRIGITHILSLGGFHLSILMGALNLLLYRTGKKTRTVTGCIFCILFMMLTGFPITVVRAGFMLILSYLLRMLTGIYDNVTSLFISALLIVAFQPYSAIDIGFILSVLATLGIIVASDYTEVYYDESVSLRKICGKLSAAVVYSLFAIASTSVLTSATFTGISTVGLPATMIFSVLLNVYIYFGILVLSVGWLFPGIGSLLIDFNTFLSSFAAKLSDIDNIYASANFPPVRLLSVVLTLLFVAFVIFKIKRKGIYVGAMLTVYIVMLVTAVSLTHREYAQKSEVIYSNEGERFVFKSSDSELLFLDASGTNRDDAYYTRYMLEEGNLPLIDHYVVPVYSKSLPDALVIILDRIKIKNLYLPSPATPEEEKAFDRISELASDFRYEILTFDPSDVIEIGECSLSVRERNYVNGAFVLTLHRGSEVSTYLSSGALEFCPIARYHLYTSDSVIFGSAGPQYETIYAIDEYGDALRRVVCFAEIPYFDTRLMNNDPTVIVDEGEAPVFIGEE